MGNMLQVWRDGRKCENVSIGVSVSEYGRDLEISRTSHTHFKNIISRTCFLSDLFSKYYLTWITHWFTNVTSSGSNCMLRICRSTEHQRNCFQCKFFMQRIDFLDPESLPAENRPHFRLRNAYLKTRNRFI